MRVPAAYRARTRAVRIAVTGQASRTVRGAGARSPLPVDFTGAGRTTMRVTLTVTLRDGSRKIVKRTFNACRPGTAAKT